MRSFAWYSVKFAALLCVLRFLGDMNWWASAILTFLFIEALSWKDRAPSPRFTPFTFTLHPKISKMLTDLGYIDEAGLKELKPDRSDPWSGGYLEAFGSTGYALQESESGWPIVHWPRLNFYTEGMGFHRQLEFMDSGTKFLPNVPGCFCRLGRTAGLAFGISVREDWWKANCDAVTAKGIVIDVQHKYHFGTVDLTMASLPVQVVHLFSGPQFVFDPRCHEKETKALTDALIKNGWMQESREHDEPWMQSPTVYQHQYVTVYMNHLHDAQR